jgi:type I restriction enzyme S subunit
VTWALQPREVEGWENTTLRSFLTRSREFGRPDLPLLSVNLSEGVVLRRAGDGRPAPAEDLSAYQVVQPDDLVMNQLGKPHGSLGVSSFEGVISPAYFVARIGATAEPRFVHHLLRTRLYISEYERRGKFMPPSQFDISWEQFRSIPVRMPTLETQRAIADYLDTETARIDALIAKKRRLIDLLDERARAAIDAALDVEVQWPRAGVPQPSVENGRPDSVRLGSVATVQSGLTLDGARVVDEHSPLLPYLRVANVQDGSVNLAELKEVRVPPALAARCSLRRGDVLMTEGGDPDKLGRGAVWEGQVQPCLHQNHVFAVRPGPALRSDYLALLTRSTYARAYFEVTASKTTGIASTSTSKIAAFRIPLMPLDEQAVLVRRWAAVNSLVERSRSCVQQQLALLQEHRQALITAAVTGELPVPEVAA